MGTTGSGDRVWATALGLQPQVKLPTAGDRLGNGHAEGLLNVPFLVNLPAGFHLGLMTSPQWERNSSNSGWAAGWVNTVCVDRVLFDKFDLFAEFASHVTDESHSQGQGTVDLGVVYQITPNLSLDTEMSINGNAQLVDSNCDNLVEKITKGVNTGFIQGNSTQAAITGDFECIHQ